MGINLADIHAGQDSVFERLNYWAVHRARNLSEMALSAVVEADGSSDQQVALGETLVELLEKIEKTLKRLDGEAREALVNDTPAISQT